MLNQKYKMLLKYIILYYLLFFSEVINSANNNLKMTQYIRKIIFIAVIVHSITQGKSIQTFMPTKKSNYCYIIN